MFKDVQKIIQQKSAFNSAPYSSKNIIENGKKSPVEDGDIYQYYAINR